MKTFVRQTKLCVVVVTLCACATSAWAQGPDLATLAKQVEALAVANQERAKKDALRDKNDAERDRILSGLVQRLPPVDARASGKKARDIAKAECQRSGLEYLGVLMLRQGDALTPTGVCK